MNDTTTNAPRPSLEDRLVGAAPSSPSPAPAAQTERPTPPRSLEARLTGTAATQPAPASSPSHAQPRKSIEERLVGSQRPAPSADAPTAASAPAAAPVQLTAPEGFAEAAPVLGAVSALAAELKLPPAVAQQHATRIVEAVTARDAAVVETMQNGWRAALLADPSIGGDQAVEDAYLAITEFGDDELRKVLGSPFGGYPPLRRFLVRVGYFVRSHYLRPTAGRRSSR